VSEVYCPLVKGDCKQSPFASSDFWEKHCVEITSKPIKRTYLGTSETTNNRGQLCKFKEYEVILELRVAPRCPSYVGVVPKEGEVTGKRRVVVREKVYPDKVKP